MPKIITFLSPKGGSGATFCIAGVWYSLVNSSFKTLACDMCFEKCGLDVALGLKNDYVYTLSDAVSESCTAEEAFCTRDNGSFVRCDYEKDFFDTDAAFDILKKSDFDYILCDVTDRDEDFVAKVLKYTDTLVYVTEPGALSVQMCERSAGLFEFDNSLVLVNKIVPTYIHKQIHLTIDEILDSIGYPLLGLVPWVPEAEIIMRQGVTFGIENKKLAEAFSNISLRLTGQKVPAADIDKVYDCFKLGRKFSVKAD